MANERLKIRRCKSIRLAVSLKPLPNMISRLRKAPKSESLTRASVGILHMSVMAGFEILGRIA